VLSAFDGLLKAAAELLEVGVAVHEIDLGGVDDEEVGGGVAEEKVFVGADNFFEVVERDVRFGGIGLFGDAAAEDVGAGLEISMIRSGTGRPAAKIS